MYIKENILSFFASAICLCVLLSSCSQYNNISSSTNSKTSTKSHSILPYSASQINDSNTFVMNNGPHPFTITAEGTKLYFTNIPSGEDYSHLHVYLNDKNNHSISAGLDMVRSPSNGAIYDITADSTTVTNGTYYLQLYFHAKDSATMNGYFENYYFPIIVQNNKITFPEPEIYPNNSVATTVEKKDPSFVQGFLSTTSDYEVDDSITAQSSKITANLKDTYDKIKAITDWVSKNIYYNYLTPSIRNITDDEESSIQVLKNRYGVCQGYADLSAALLIAADIPAKVVDGNAPGDSASGAIHFNESLSDSDHVWVEAWYETEKRWITIDPTFDSSNEYDGDSKFESGFASDQYFDISNRALSLNHQITAVNGEGIDEYIVLSKATDNLNLTTHTTDQLGMYFESGNIYDYVTWSSSNNRVVTVDKSEKIKAISVGKAVITAQINYPMDDGWPPLKATCTVTVTK